MTETQAATPEWSPERARACQALLGEHFDENTSAARRMEILRELGLAAPAASELAATAVILRAFRQPDGKIWLRCDGQTGPVCEHVLPIDDAKTVAATLSQLAVTALEGSHA